jgi:hypothetical protein
MEEREIIRLDIERFQWMLETELDWPARPMIESVMREYENRLIAIQNGKSAPGPFHSIHRAFSMRTKGNLP